MTRDLSTILDELLETRRVLQDAPGDDLERRVELRDRLITLRAAAAHAARTSASDASLSRYLEQLEARRERIRRLHMDASWQDGSVAGTGLTARQTGDFNRMIDAASDLPDLEAEIARVRAKLAG